MDIPELLDSRSASFISNLNAVYRETNTISETFNIDLNEKEVFDLLLAKLKQAIEATDFSDPSLPEEAEALRANVCSRCVRLG